MKGFKIIRFETGRYNLKQGFCIYRYTLSNLKIVLLNALALLFLFFIFFYTHKTLSDIEHNLPRLHRFLILNEHWAGLTKIENIMLGVKGSMETSFR